MSFTCHNIFTQMYWNFPSLGMRYDFLPLWYRFIWTCIAYYNIRRCYHHISYKISWSCHSINYKYNFTSEIWISTVNRNCFRSQPFIMFWYVLHNYTAHLCGHYFRWASIGTYWNKQIERYFYIMFLWHDISDFCTYCLLWILLKIDLFIKEPLFLLTAPVSLLVNVFSKVHCDMFFLLDDKSSIHNNITIAGKCSRQRYELSLQIYKFISKLWLILAFERKRNTFIR